MKEHLQNQSRGQTAAHCYATLYRHLQKHAVYPGMLGEHTSFPVTVKIVLLYAIRIPADLVNCPKQGSRLCSHFQSSQHGMTIVDPGCRFLSFSLCQLMRQAQCVASIIYSCQSSQETLRKKHPQGVCRRYAFHSVSFCWCENSCQRRVGRKEGGK